jgi:predicted MFS family arabinose efflux permease
MEARDDINPSRARALWTLMLASFVSTLPITAMNLFVAPIAADLQTTAAMVGGLRGLGGVAALLVGFALAPLIDQVPRAPTVSSGLVLIAIASLLVTVGQVTGLITFYLLFGMTRAALAPTLQAASADHLDGPAAGRAAAAMGSAQTLSSVLAGPLLAIPALLAGWQGAYVAMGTTAICLGLLCAITLDWRRPPGVTRAGYRAAFRIVAQAPGALPLLAASSLRSCVHFAWLTFLATFFAEQFGASTGLVAWVWFLGAGAFCIVSLLVGRVANPAPGQHADGWGSPTRLLLAGMWVMAAFAPLVFVSPTVPLAIGVTVAFAVGAGASQAALDSVLVRRYVDVRGAVMGLNAAGVNVGMIGGASVAGASLGVGGFEGLAVMLIGLTTVAAIIMHLALRTADVDTVREVPMPA